MAKVTGLSKKTSYKVCEICGRPIDRGKYCGKAHKQKAYRMRIILKDSIKSNPAVIAIKS